MEKEVAKYLNLITHNAYVSPVLGWLHQPYFIEGITIIILLLLFFYNKRTGKIIIASTIVSIIFYFLILKYVGSLDFIKNLPDIFRKSLKNADEFIVIVSIFFVFMNYYRKFLIPFILILILIALASIKDPMIMLVDAFLGIIIGWASVKIIELFYGKSRLRNFD